MSKLIDSISLPTDLRSLETGQLKTVADELRNELIDTIAAHGGHFASSLGVTELTVALHHVFNTPDDRLIWDVGHQGYIHKMLTGRRDKMHTIRKKNGISGFLKRSESEFDAFGAGHAGTSISAGVGMAVSAQKTHPDRSVVPIIGDGSLTSGMAFEALNHAGDLGLKNLIVVLNDNEMSIAPNVGAMSWFFSGAVTSKTSTKARSKFKSLYQKGYIPEIVYKAIDRAEEATQGFISAPAMLFEAFGFRYIGPVDGHHIDDLVKALKAAKAQDVPVLVHTYTSKGKGYDPAEADPVKWHATSPFNREQGVALSSAPSAPPPPTFTQVFAKTLIALRQKNEKIVGVTAAMPTGTGLDKFQKEYPDSYFDAGICEQHAVTFCAGLACEGYVPFCTIYSTFLQRGFDQIVHDVCVQNLPVVFAMDRSGVVGNDGETHQGLFDIAYLRTLPNMVVMSPKDEREFQDMLYTASIHDGPIALRYPRGSGAGAELAEDKFETLPIGKAERLTSGSDILFCCFGPVTQSALKVGKRLEDEFGLSSTVVNSRFAKPLDTELLAEELPKHRLVCVIEDHVLAGGFSSALLELINDNAITLKQPILRFGVGDEFVAHGSQAEQQAEYGFDSVGIYQFIVERLKPRKAVSF